MPRYFFDTTDLIHAVDAEGAVLPDLDAARAMAFTAVGEMLTDQARPGIPARCQTTVRDEAGTRLLIITGHLSEEAAETAPFPPQVGSGSTS